MSRRLAAILAAFVLTASSAPTPEPSAPAGEGRKYRLERVGDAAVAQIYADGFAALPLDQKALIYHLYEAAIAGRDIYYDQRYAHSLEMRDVIEAVVAHPAGVAAETLAAVQTYAKLFWLNSGPYNNLTARKFVLETTPEAFGAAVKTASASGAMLPLTAGETVDHMLTRMQPWFFDATFEPSVTTKTPGPGQEAQAPAPQQVPSDSSSLSSSSDDSTTPAPDAPQTPAPPRQAQPRAGVEDVSLESEDF